MKTKPTLLLEELESLKGLVRIALSNAEMAQAEGQSPIPHLLDARRRMQDIVLTRELIELRKELG